MIDWVTARLPCSNSGQICDGQVVKLNAEGSEIEWTTQTRLSLTGSHDSSISIRSLTPQTIEISGNPAKWLQGHNLLALMICVCSWVFFNRLIEFYDIGLNPTIQDLERIKEGRYTVSRVDINETWFLKIVLKF